MNLVADTNIWLRIADHRAAQHREATESLAKLLAEGARLFLVPQNLIEFWAVATRSHTANGLDWTIERTATEVNTMRSKFEMLPENDQLFQKWLDVVTMEKISGKRVHDARLAVHLLVHQISHLLTFNTADFAKFSWFTVLSPADVCR